MLTLYWNCQLFIDLYFVLVCKCLNSRTYYEDSNSLTLSQLKFCVSGNSWYVKRSIYSNKWIPTSEWSKIFYTGVFFLLAQVIYYDFPYLVCNPFLLEGRIISLPTISLSMCYNPNRSFYFKRSNILNWFEPVMKRIIPIIQIRSYKLFRTCYK